MAYKTDFGGGGITSNGTNPQTCPANFASTNGSTPNLAQYVGGVAPRGAGTSPLPRGQASGSIGGAGATGCNAMGCVGK
jgi:hypothetical protein